jgi:uncharacterized protein (UPF0332 family)
MQKQHKDILIKINIEKSDEAIKFAGLALKENGLTTALNRIYYAIFYTVTALAEKHDFKTSKHSKLMGWFNKKFVSEDKVFNKNIYKIYESAFLSRQKGDYDAAYATNIEQAAKLLSEAKIFIETVREAI